VTSKNDLPMAEGRRGDSARRRQRVENARVSRAPLQADLANALERNARLTARVRQLENRLSQQLGEQAWRDFGLGAPTDIDNLQRQVTALEQRVVDLQGQLEDRAEELQAARAANRELTRTLDQTHR
jgi:regulator of replication initiation timing